MLNKKKLVYFFLLLLSLLNISNNKSLKLAPFTGIQAENMIRATNMRGVSTYKKRAPIKIFIQNNY
jgi:hypothetical protein